MDTQPDNPEDIDRLLADARKALQDFEDGADRKRLLLRLRTASPAHPVLLARFLFGGLAIVGVVAAVAIMILTQIDNDLARTLALFDDVIPMPEEIPALPTLMGILSLMMAIAWIMATLAAMQLGREATMLPWEQKQHQKLVNEVTRLTTQKAVMERIRSTPAGARPRIATPVPVSARTRTAGGLASRGAPSTGATPPPAYLASEGPGPSTYAPPSAGRSGLGGAGGLGGFGRPSPTAEPEQAPSQYSPPAARPAAGGFGSSPAGRSFPPGSRVGASPRGGLLARASQSGGSGAGGFAPVSSTLEPSAYTEPSAPPPSGYAALPTARRGAPTPEDDPVSIPVEEEAPHTNGYGHVEPAAQGARLSLRPQPSAPPATNGVAASAGGGVRLGARASTPPAPSVDDFSDLVEISTEAQPPRQPTPSFAADRPPIVPDPGAAGPGILGRARAGATGLRSTPYGAAGRIRPPPVASAKPAAPQAPSQVTPAVAMPAAEPAAAVERPRVSAARPPDVGLAPPSREEREPVSTRGGTPLGAAPRAGASVRTRPSAPPASVPEKLPGLPGGMFGTPPPVSRTSVPPTSERVDEVVVMEEEEDIPTVQTSRPSPESAPPRSSTRAAASNPAPALRAMPRFQPIDEEWLGDALVRAEALLSGFPVQAYLEFSQEPHLPFTLVIARATPAMAVRAMVNFVEFLAGIATPPRARIELVNIPHLDRSFHKNVEAALEPYFGGNVEVEPNPGRVDILFTDPDPQWGNWPVLPLEQAPEP